MGGQRARVVRLPACHSMSFPTFQSGPGGLVALRGVGEAQLVLSWKESGGESDDDDGAVNHSGVVGVLTPIVFGSVHIATADVLRARRAPNDPPRLLSAHDTRTSRRTTEAHHIICETYNLVYFSTAPSIQASRSAFSGPAWLNMTQWSESYSFTVRFLHHRSVAGLPIAGMQM